METFWKSDKEGRILFVLRKTAFAAAGEVVIRAWLTRVLPESVTVYRWDHTVSERYALTANARYFKVDKEVERGGRSYDGALALLLAPLAAVARVDPGLAEQLREMDPTWRRMDLDWATTEIKELLTESFDRDPAEVEALSEASGRRLVDALEEVRVLFEGGPVWEATLALGTMLYERATSAGKGVVRQAEMIENDAIASLVRGIGES